MNDKLLRNKSHDTRCFLHQFRYLISRILIGSSEFLLRIILCNILQTKNPDREIFPTEFLPIGYLPVKNILYLSRTQNAYLITFIQRQRITFLDHSASE